LLPLFFFDFKACPAGHVIFYCDILLRLQVGESPPPEEEHGCCEEEDGTSPIAMPLRAPGLMALPASASVGAFEVCSSLG